MRYNASIERLDDGATRAHLMRYYVAKGFVRPGDTVIDAACGTGYGSRLLAEIASKVYSFDQVDDINDQWKMDNIEYAKIDLDKEYPYPKADILISLETLEHLKHPGTFLSSVLPQISKFFVYSVPLNEEPGANPFHLQTFTQTSILNLVSRDGWKHFHSVFQGNHFIGSMYR